MKKHKLIALAALVVIMSACKKDWNCDCKVTAVDESQSFTIPTHEILDQSKSDAEETCNTHGEQYNTIVTTLDCNLSQK